MSAAKNTRSDAQDRQKKILAGSLFGVIAVGVLYYELSDPSPAAPASAVVSTAPAAVVTNPAGKAGGTAARSVGNTSAALDPTLHMQAMLVTESVAYTGSGRNIFGAGASAEAEIKPIPKAIASGRQQSAPAPYVPSGPPPPPPIDLKFFGTATSAKSGKQAFLLHGDDVFLASTGDIVQRKYKIVSIGSNSIQVEDLTNNNRQTLPLLVGR